MGRKQMIRSSRRAIDCLKKCGYKAGSTIGAIDAHIKAMERSVKYEAQERKRRRRQRERKR